MLLATGSEVQLALAAREQLAAEGIGARVVSMPCLEWFGEQDAAYRESVLPAAVTRAGLGRGRRRPRLAEVRRRPGARVVLEHYGASADVKTLFREFGITAEHVVAAAKESLAS